MDGRQSFAPLSAAVLSDVQEPALYCVNPMSTSGELKVHTTLATFVVLKAIAGMIPVTDGMAVPGTFQDEPFHTA